MRCYRVSGWMVGALWIALFGLALTATAQQAQTPATPAPGTQIQGEGRGEACELARENLRQAHQQYHQAREAYRQAVQEYGRESQQARAAARVLNREQNQLQAARHRAEHCGRQARRRDGDDRDVQQRQRGTGARHSIL